MNIFKTPSSHISHTHGGMKIIQILYTISKRVRIVLGRTHNYTSWTNQEVNAKEVNIDRKFPGWVTNRNWKDNVEFLTWDMR